MSRPLSPNLIALIAGLALAAGGVAVAPPGWQGVARPEGVPTPLPGYRPLETPQTQPQQVARSHQAYRVASLAAQGVEPGPDLALMPVSDTPANDPPLRDLSSAGLELLPEESEPSAEGLLVELTDDVGPQIDTDLGPPGVTDAAPTRPRLPMAPTREDDWASLAPSAVTPLPPPVPLALEGPWLAEADGDEPPPAADPPRLPPSGPPRPVASDVANRLSPRTGNYPATLLARLEALATPPRYRQWATDATEAVKRLADRPGYADARELFDDLRGLLGEAARIDTVDVPEAQRVQLRLSAYALLRWLDVQQAAAEVLHRGAGTRQVSAHDVSERLMAAGTIAEIISRIEHFEATGSAESSRVVAEAAAQLVAIDDAVAQGFGRRIGQHYRNLNIRITLSPELLNRIIPAPETEEGRVAEWVDGHLVYGRSQTATNLEVAIEPHEHAWQLFLSAQGLVDSHTRMNAGAATFGSSNRSRFHAIVPVTISHNGSVAGQPLVRVASASRLNDVATNLDSVPLVGAIARTYAEFRHAQRQDDARGEMDRRVSARVRSALSQTLDGQIEASRNRLQGELLAPLARLNLEVGPSAFATHDTALVLRTRLAGGDQLAAFTPRPREPDGCWLSVQLHESVLNNLADRLALAGETLRLCDLPDRLAFKNEGLLADFADELPDNVTVSFGREDPIRLFYRDGRIELCLRLDRLEVGDHLAQDLTVRVFYRVDQRGRTVELVRDGGVQLATSDGTRSRLMVRTVLAKAFSVNRTLPLVTAEQLATWGLDDLGVVQAELREGWASLALAPCSDPVDSPRPTESLAEDDGETFLDLTGSDPLDGLTPLD